MDDRVDLRPRLKDAGMDHHLVALQDAGRAVDQIAVEVAHHHVLGLHARQHIDLVTAAFDDEAVGIVRIAQADMPHRARTPDESPVRLRMRLPMRDLVFDVVESHRRPLSHIRDVPWRPRRRACRHPRATPRWRAPCRDRPSAPAPARVPFWNAASSARNFRRMRMMRDIGAAEMLFRAVGDRRRSLILDRRSVLRVRPLMPV